MAKQTTKHFNNQSNDVREYIELLKSLTSEEKREVKGIMIGMWLVRHPMEKLPTHTRNEPKQTDGFAQLSLEDIAG